MKAERNILIAFVLNFAFSIFELVGGIVTGSVAIASDAMHDFGDAVSIGISYFLEKRSKKQPDDSHTYGYGRYSVIGGALTSLVLLSGSLAMIYNAIIRIISPADINYDGMIIFAVVGICVNFVAALLTHGSCSLNQKAVNMHMLEDVLSWGVVLFGAVVMKFTDFTLIDPIMSCCVSAFISFNAIMNLKEAFCLFIEKVPQGISVGTVKERVLEIDGVIDVHHIHLWSIDGRGTYATMHVVTGCNMQIIKKEIREQLLKYGISHVTLETEAVGESCPDVQCRVEYEECSEHKHQHHHHN